MADKKTLLNNFPAISSNNQVKQVAVISPITCYKFVSIKYFYNNMLMLSIRCPSLVEGSYPFMNKLSSNLKRVNLFVFLSSNLCKSMSTDGAGQLGTCWK